MIDSRNKDSEDGRNTCKYRGDKEDKVYNNVRDRRGIGVFDVY